MGIKHINEILNEKCPEVFKKIPVNTFSGKNIAIDSNLFLNSIICTSYKHFVFRMIDPLEDIDVNDVLKHCVNQVIQFITKLMGYKINLIWVWDGSCENDKLVCREKRIKAKKDQNEKIEKKKEELMNTNILLRTPTQIKEYKNLLANRNIMNREILGYLRNIIELLGFSSIQAPSEGEKMCSNLCSENLVSAVWSKDTDNYILGSSTLILGFSGIDEENNLLLDVVDVDLIFKILEVSKEWFLDLCILLGCDFNTNIPKIGQKKSWELLEKNGSIENILENNPKLDSSFLNYEKCREIFKPENTGLNSKSKELFFDKDKFIEYFNDIFEQYDLSSNYKTFKCAIELQYFKNDL
jgi:flap endonuclease-1